MSSRPSSSRRWAPREPTPLTRDEVRSTLIAHQYAVTKEVRATHVRRYLTDALWQFRQDNPIVDRVHYLDSFHVKACVTTLTNVVVHREAAESIMGNPELMSRLEALAVEDLRTARKESDEIAVSTAEELMTSTAYDVEQLVEMSKSYAHMIKFNTGWYPYLFD